MIQNLYTPDASDPNKAYKEWRDSFEENTGASTSGRRLFRKSNFQFPNPTQFRQSYFFNAGGAVVVTKLQANGSTASYSGTWVWTEGTRTLVLRYTDAETKQNVVLSWEVITLVQDLLLVKST